MAVAALPQDRFLGVRVTPINRRRIDNFRANRRGYWSLWIFLVLFVLSMFAELIANDRPLLVRYDGQFYFPVVRFYPETAFGGDFGAEADYTDPYIAGLIEKKGWIVWPPIPYDANTHIAQLPSPAPSPPTADNWLGTDDQARDVMALGLGQQGATVTAVPSVAEALVAVERDWPDVLLGDIGMPGEDGYDLIREVRRLEAIRGRHIPAIAVTGYAADEDRRRALEAGYEVHVAKPVPATVVAPLIESLLSPHGPRFTG